MTHGQNNGSLRIEAIQRDVTAASKGDEPLAKLWIHVLHWAPCPRLITQDLHPLTDGLGGTACCVRIFLGKNL